MGSQRSILFLVPIVSNNKEYNHENEFSVAFLYYWPLGTLPKYSRRRVFMFFDDVSNS